eukprot:CAMPEP_0177304784 /NCGR_PEP_ID=MMETSP0368-20130122/6834_1 /TAXON_ID=447022 ORGANISM="Scrippsiella hangoei-like, Strain SHHI-4" /NCGR_SAMPLE_ID=MMETSP0368 /ASSEMBLY_ACC=CAM_ASM_000363 /LENGTH=71 /DNA_ID=CAMNT_0018763387 /DNA_START=608 /DNA_END=823 /DNA_ORIENTATION=-
MLQLRLTMHVKPRVIARVLFSSMTVLIAANGPPNIAMVMTLPVKPSTVTAEVASRSVHDTAHRAAVATNPT